MILSKSKSLANAEDDPLVLLKAIHSVRKGQETKERVAVIKQAANDFSSKLALEMYVKDLLERGKVNKAFILVNSGLKFYYREPVLWQLLGSIYQIQAQEADDEHLMQKAVVAYQKSAKYLSRNRGKGARECLLNSASYLQVINFVIEAELALD